MINKGYPSHLRRLPPIFILFLSSSMSVSNKPQNQSTTLVNVGVVLHDLNHSVTGKIWLSAIQMALSDFYVSHPHYNIRLVLKVREYKQDSVLGAANAALDLINKEQVQAIIGPVTSMETSFVINIGDEAHVPIISFSATSPSLNSPRSSFFFQFAQNDASQVQSLSALIKKFGWSQVVPVYVNNVYGIIPFLSDALQEVDAHIPYRSVFSPSATDDEIEGELYKLMTMQTRVFIVHMTKDLCAKLFVKAQEIGMMDEGYVWLITNGIANGLESMSSSVINSMLGVIGVQTYVQETKELEEVKLRWKRQFQKDNPLIVGAELDVFGLWAYDSAFALAMATEQVFGTSSSTNGSNNVTGDDTILTSPYGPKLCEALSTTRFEGMAGNFSLVDGQLQSSNFSIVNVDGRGARSVGFWTPQNGLVRKLDSESIGILGPIIWPGDSLSAPKGWVYPTPATKLRIAVPVENNFPVLVRVSSDPMSHKTIISGLSIDVFTAAVNLLPYNLPYEFIPFANPDGTNAGTYNDMCYQVYLGNFDAAVGDIIYTQNRSSYVDFTAAYLEDGIAIVVPLLKTGSQDAWVFLKPWTWDLWLSTFCFFLFTGFVVWVLEHQVNEDFRGPPSHQVGTGLWFSFSTMVFAPTAKVVSNLGRLVMAVWIFVVLVLTISYTANLTSLYTVQQLRPTMTGFTDLLKKGSKVGYLSNSNVYYMLKQIGFSDNRLRSYQSMEQIDDALTKGSGFGGIDATIDETPYMMLFLAQYCNKYTMIGPFYNTDGLSFVFEKKSPILPDMSLAIFKMISEGQMADIKSKWFKNDSNCQGSNAEGGFSSSIGTNTFSVLFLVAGVTSSLALIIFVVSFIYKHRHIFKQPADARLSTWTKIQTMFKIFNEKDPNHHAFKSSQPPSADEASPHHPHSPVSDNSSHTDTISVFSEELQLTSSTEHASPEMAHEVVLTIQGMQISTPTTAQENN